VGENIFCLAYLNVEYERLASVCVKWSWAVTGVVAPARGKSPFSGDEV
jgi:hypothetical protein